MVMNKFSIIVKSINRLLRLSFSEQTIHYSDEVTSEYLIMSHVTFQKKSCRSGRKTRNVAALIKSVSLFFAKGVTTGMKAESRVVRSEAKKVLHFTRQEIEALGLIYDKLVGEPYTLNNSGQQSPPSSPRAQKKEGIERVVFRDLLHSTFDLSTEEILMDRIFSVFDAGSDGLIKKDEWLAGTSVFLKGSLEERTAFTFAVYDLNSDGFIVREEMFTLLRDSLVKQPQEEDPDEGVKELVELVLRRLDQDKDGKVSFEDFRLSVLQEPLFLEAFGPCLPEEPATAAFLATLS